MTVYLRLDGIAGEVRAKGREGWIDSHSMSWGTTLDPVVNAARRQQRATAREVTVTLPTSSASPLLLEALATARRIPRGQIDIVANGESTRAAVAWQFEEVSLTAFSTVGGPDDATDELVFTVARVRLGVARDPGNGKLEPPVVRGWDFLTGLPW